MNLLEVIGLTKYWPKRDIGIFKQLLDRELVFEFLIEGSRRRRTYAVNGISLALKKGECLGVVGESGSGKTTLIRILSGLLPASAGQVMLKNKEHDPVANRGVIQMVFQDPTESLNPAFTVRRIIADPIICMEPNCGAAERNARIETLAGMVQLPVELLDRYPHQLSGGQKARVGIARALAAKPEIILLDEPTTALDVSVQGHILLLLDELRRSLSLSYIFVSHDLSVVKILCDRLVVMKKGVIVEQGSVSEVFANAQHPYTRDLIQSVPKLKPG